MRVGRKLALLTAAAVMAVVPVGGARAATTYTVQMGVEVPHGFSTRVMAPLDHNVPTIEVATNDVVDLVGGAILLPEGTGPLEWAAENTQGLDAPFGFLKSDPDQDLEEPFSYNATYKFNDGLFAPNFACGSAATPCPFDGSGVVSSGDVGVNDGHFYVEVTANPGTTLWAVNLFNINKPSSLRIRVVANPADATTQAEVDAARATLAALESDAAAALHAKLNRASTKHKTPSGQVIHDAYVGYDTNTFALFDMYPANLKIRKGHKVRFHFSQLGIEVHGAAFPFKAGMEIANNGFIPVCDPDGPADGPDTFDVDFETFSCPTDKGEMELDLADFFTMETGDGKFPGGPTKLENSGLRGAQIPAAPGLDPLAPWDLKFTKPNLKGYKYICTLHGKSMLGKVTVRN